MSESTPTKIVLAVCFVAGAVMVFAPLLAIALFEPPFATQTDASLLRELGDPWLWGLLAASLRLAFITTVLSLAVGVPLGFKLATRFGILVAALGLAHLLPLSLPPYIVGLGFASFTGTGGLLAGLAGADAGEAASGWLYCEAGAVFVLVVSLSPIVTLSTALFARGLNPRLIEAALSMRRPGAVFGRIAIPLVAPGALLGALVVFVFAFSEVAVPQLLGLKVYATAVFTRLADLSFEPAVAIARSLPPVVLATIASAGLYFIDRYSRASSGLKPILPTALFDGGPGVLFNIVLGVAGLLAMLPATALFVAATLAPGGGISAFLEGGGALINSLEYAFASACAMLAIAIPLGWAWSRYPTAGNLASVPLLLGFLVPAAVLGTGLIVMWNRPGTQWIYQGSGIMVLGFAARYSFLPARAIMLGFKRSQQSWHEAALLSEPSGLRRFIRVSLMGNPDAIAGGFAIAFLTCFRDLDTAVLFYPPGGETLIVRTMTIEANAPPGQTAANAALQVVATSLMAAVAYVFLKGRKR